MVLMTKLDDRILYEDNHLIIVNKLPGELVQGDDTGDRTLADDVKSYLKEKYNKPGNVYLGIPHRLDRPTSGIVVYCKTDKALSRMTALFRTSDVKKTYWAIVDKAPESHRTPSPDKSAACGAGDTYQRGPEVWCPAFKSRWRHMSSRQTYHIHASGAKGTC